MSYETWMEFNDKLVSTGVFNCNQCQNVLIPPVMLSDRYGNICSVCYKYLAESGDTGLCVENQALTIVLGDIFFPCRYKGADCHEKLSINDLRSHEEACSYKTTACIYSTNCQWKGRRLNLMKHLLESHRDKILQNGSDRFIIETNLQTENDTFYILETTSGKFIMRVKVVPTLRRMYLKVYDYEEKEAEYEFKLKIESKQNLVCYKTLLKVVKAIETLSDFKIDNATEVDLDALKQSLRTEVSATVKNVIKITCKDEEAHFENSMLNLMNCPECKKILRPPIYQCITGHTICSACKAKLIKCPSCDETFGDTRNYTLETLAYKIRYPCQYESSGCKVKVLLTNNHESVCDYQLYSCFMKKCNFKAAHIDLMDHLRQEHCKFCFEGAETVHFKKSLNSPQDAAVTRVCLLNYNNIFKMTNGHDLSHVHWGINLISPHQDKSTFIYEIAIYDPHEREKKLIRRGILTNKQIYIFSISKDELKEFLDGDTLNYYFRVIKKC